jgi:hypothetical protein
VPGPVLASIQEVVSELRLWDALDADLLVPFHYFGVSDDVDLSQLEWKRGNYDTAQLNNLYTGNDARAAKVIRERRDRVTSTEGKAVLTVMDFIGQQHREFRFDLRYRALTGYGLKEVVFGAIRERCEGDRSTRDSWTGYLRQAGLLEGFSPLETVLSGRTRELSDADANRLLLMKSTLKEEPSLSATSCRRVGR